MNKLNISNSVGNNLANHEKDVLKVKSILSRLGHLDLDSQKAEPHGYITQEMDMALKDFQNERNLRIDGLMFPHGETEKAMDESLKNMNEDSNEGDVDGGESEGDEDGNLPAVPPPVVESEDLPPPNIPGTNIPDEGRPESYPSIPGGRVIKDPTVPMPSITPPNPNIDPGMEIPNIGPYAPWELPNYGRNI